MNVLILTQLQDMHALSVAHALQLKGHRPVLWYGADFPISQSGSISISPSRSPQGVVNWAITGPGVDLKTDQLDVVWHRRPRSAVLPEDMHPEDREVAESECKAFTSALWQIIAPDAFWVNPLSSRDYARSKPVQLLEALRVGLLVPPTLYSNDPFRIRQFIEAHSGDVIYKPFRTARWGKGEENPALLLTSVVRADDLPDDDILRLSPGIFQPKIEKEYELRVTCMGGLQVAAKLMSQEDDALRLDWRAAFGSNKNLRIESTQLPDNISLSCRQLMSRLGIVFGCIDFIVTPNGDYIFLEINETGQFLWIEYINPEIRLLEPFTEFLINCGAEFEWRPSKRGGIYLLDFFDELASRHVQEEIPMHVADYSMIFLSRS
jgi:glutathione synthase/RimK-type ligase-like ATP-grasp enzyme